MANAPPPNLKIDAMRSSKSLVTDNLCSTKEVCVGFGVRCRSVWIHSERWRRRELWEAPAVTMPSSLHWSNVGQQPGRTRCSSTGIKQQKCEPWIMNQV